VQLGSAFGEAPSISIDHAVMERTDRAVVVPLDAGWTDVGSWNSVWEALAVEGDTVTSGEVLAVDVHGSYIRSESRPVAVIGLDNVVVIETPEGILVMDRERSQDVRLAAEWQAGKGRQSG
jgi:mannose-1-phosphate guanylyltransferase